MDVLNWITIKARDIMNNWSKEDLNIIKRNTTGKVYYLQQYLKDLTRLLQRNVISEELLSLNKTDLFFQHIPKWKIIHKVTLNFSDKESLVKFIQQNILTWDTSYMMYLSNIEYCGMLRIRTLSHFNWNFRFDDELCGLICFIREDYKEKIVLDFYEEDLDYFIDVEILR